MRLEDKLRERVICQDEAVAAVAAAIQRSRTGLRDPSRPIGSFIFAGQTGVGKTELCRALAEALFGSDDAMIRLDMSEYMEKHSVSKLIGSPPGYIGYDDGGMLTEKIRRKPYSIVLFDEIEKAHPDVFNILLQILDDGVLTDSQGRRVNFKNAIIIMTTNLGARRQGEVARLGFGATNSSHDDVRSRVEDALRTAFRPEFLNRVDEVIVFCKLRESDLAAIASLMLAKVADRIESSGVLIEFDDDVANLIAKDSKTDEYGARPIRRAIINLVELPYSRALLDGSFKKGDFIRAFCRDGKVEFEKKGR